MTLENSGSESWTRSDKFFLALLGAPPPVSLLKQSHLKAWKVIYVIPKAFVPLVLGRNRQKL